MIYDFYNDNGAEISAEIIEDKKTHWKAWDCMECRSNLKAIFYSDGKRQTRRAFAKFYTDRGSWHYADLCIKYQNTTWRANLARV